MDKKAQLLQALAGLAPEAPVQVWQAVVKKVDGVNCTVDLINTDLKDVPDVSLRADDEATEGTLVVPRVGSLIYVGAVDNAMDSLFVVHVSEVDQVQVTIGKVALNIDKTGVTATSDKVKVTISDKEVTAVNDKVQVSVTNSQVSAVNDKVSMNLSTSSAKLAQDQTTVELSGGKVSVKNSGGSLKGLFDDLTTLLQSFQVTCAAPGSPSAPFPASVAMVAQLKTKVNLLLS
jgi:hypothetical protein